MIRKFTITNYVGDILELPLTDPYSSGFLIREVQGLGPVKADIHMVEPAMTDGGIFNSARASSRNIVFSFLFVSEKKTINEIRLDSYKYFPLKKEVKILVETDERVAEITGYVESNEPDIFSQDCGCQISIVCPDSYFHAFKSKRTIITGVDPRFKFPFSNESLTEKLINFGEIRTKKDAPVYNDGDEDVGISIQIHAKGPIEGLTIWNVSMKEMLGIDDNQLQKIIGSKIQAGDDVIINTMKGKKSAILKRKGRRFNILNALKNPIRWLRLQRGENIFAYMADVGEDSLDLVIENQILYEGV